jgi:uncharacterized protein YdaU (DUF1376 family)
MNKSPAFQFYPKDYLETKVIRMSDSAQGVYMRMLCRMWNDSKDQCSITKNVKDLSRVLNVSESKLKKYLQEINRDDDAIFIEEDGRYISLRLREEKNKQAVRSTKARESADARWMQGKSERNANASPKQCSSFSSTTSTTITNKTTPPYPPSGREDYYSQDFIMRKDSAIEITRVFNDRLNCNYSTEDWRTGHIKLIMEKLKLYDPSQFYTIIENAKKNEWLKAHCDLIRPSYLFGDKFEEHLIPPKPKQVITADIDAMIAEEERLAKEGLT